MARPDEILARAEGTLERMSLKRIDREERDRALRLRRRRQAAAARSGWRLLMAALTVFVAAIVWSFAIGPIGQFGFLAAIVALVVSWTVILMAGKLPEETPERLIQAELPALPQRTETWLQSQRPALPAPAARLVDSIGLRLEAIQPQLVGLDPREPAAHEVRKLIAEELPELIQGYARVPRTLRSEERNGMTPDAQLIEGLTVVESELARMSADLASGDLHNFQTQGRYLELKYRDGNES